MGTAPLARTLDADDASRGDRLARSCESMARLAAAAVSALGLVVLFGWVAGVPWLQHPLRGFVRMSPNSALSFVAMGVSLGLAVSEPTNRGRRTASRALAVLVGALALAILGEYVFDVDLGLTKLFPHPARPERMSPPTAVAFVLFALALLALDLAPRVRPTPAEVLAIAGMFLGALTLGAHAYGAWQFHVSLRHPHAVGMSIHAAAGLVVLGLGLLCARPRTGAMAVFASPFVGGRVARRMLLTVLAVPIVGHVAVRLQWRHLYEPPGAAVVTAVVSVIVVTMLGARFGAVLDRADARRRRAEAESRQWQQFFAGAPFGVALGTLDGRMGRVNEAFARAHGFTREELEGRPIAEIFPPHRREELARNIRIAFERGRCRWDSENLRKDGSVYPVVIDTGAIYDEQGKVVHRATYMQDITAEKRAEEARARLVALVEGSDDAILLKTVDGIVLGWNRGAERLFGWTADEMVGRSILTVVPEDRRVELEAIRARALAGAPVVNFETVSVRKDGARIPIALTMSAVHDASGQVIGISTIERDISLLKQLEREREEWAAVVAHDLRQPATAIRVAASALGALEGEAKQKAATRIRGAAERLERMIEDLLDISRTEASRLEIRPRREAVAKLVEEVLDLAPDVARRCAVHVDVGPIEVWADSARFIQVHANLLSNAEKYGYPATPIELHVERGGGVVTFTVTNEGPGIGPDELPLLFSRFARTRAARSGPTPGLGLGLYICRGLVEAHGGRMWAESVPGRRTSFHFTLPEAAPAEEHPPVN